MKQPLKFGESGLEKIRTGMTKKHFAVLGDPIGHSLSPRIHTAAYEHLDLEWDYARLQVAKGELETFLRESSSEYSGFSVTMPLKVEAAALAEAGDQIVEVLGVANTLARSESSWIGYNTDVFGIQRALANAWSENLARVAILGAGATAQSALYALSLSAPESSVDVYVRDTLGAQQISALAKLLGMNLAVHNLSEFGTAQNLTISTVPAEALEQFATQSQQGWLST